MAISFGGDPENYMDPPQMSHAQAGDSSGGSFIANLLELVGLQRNVSRGPKKGKTAKKAEETLNRVDPATKNAAKLDAQDWIDSQGSALAAQDLINSKPLTPILLPPSNVRQGI